MIDWTLNRMRIKIYDQIISVDAESHKHGRSLLSNMLTSKQFVRLVKENKCACYHFHLNPLRDEKIIQETDTDISAHIENYKDVFPEKLPPGLPPKRTVEMTIDLEN